MKAAGKTPNHTQGELHPRNRHRAPYDFHSLVQSCPELKRFLQPHPLGGDTIDFASPAAVVTLNRALLKNHYGIARWDIPKGSLCPPIPSRADYLHYAADLLAEDSTALPRGPTVRVLDIGTGANCVYPLLGNAIHGWRFVGTDVADVSANWARQLVAANPSVADQIEIRHQRDEASIFAGVVSTEERFALSLCNPPFHASAAEASAGTLRKLKNLHGGRPPGTALNFGGRSNELWCEGGEAGFVHRMIRESATRPELCVWFTTLVSKRGSLPAIARALKRVRAIDVRTIGMFAGQKQSRIVAWTFLSASQRRDRLQSALNSNNGYSASGRRHASGS